MRISAFVPLLALAVVVGCKEELAQLPVPEPAALTEDAAGHYCQMEILQHPGPKAQVYLAGLPAPLWFSQVRDGIAYLKSPEQSAEILVLYVNDMGAAASWEDPGTENWIRAAGAYFVVGSDAIGGMSAPEIAPFSDIEKARQFAALRGGVIMNLAEIPAAAVLSPIEFQSAALEGSE